MGVVLAIVVTSFAVGVLMHAGSGHQGGRGAFVWAGLTLLLSAVGSIAAQIARPWLFPEWLVRDPSMFARKLSTGELVLSFFLELLFDYGPVAAVAMVMILFAVESKGASGGSPSRPADWHRRM